ncbi:MAG: peptide chain release factor N(5)-glutamine methyltransferase [Acidobacteria bacterium]|nr:peptide chain release factor N(5)-glutamine methyltransferase [Acidobacteriota bacterium]MCB9377497.1 peptide chain release factor N(5)-glutamine methyltransferase [Holophagales bacterium]
MATVRELQGEGRRRLAGRVDSFPGRESSRLLAHLLGLSEGSLPAFDDREVEPETERRFLDLVDRRAAGEPAAYLTGGREFFGRRFQVDRRVLVPRPETEHLIEIALGLPVPARARVLDVGTGSGAIAVTLAAERPEWRVVGADLSLAALAVARGNGRALLGGASPPWVAADLVSAIDLSSFDLVVSNPPYVDPEDGALDPDVRAHEPALALFAAKGLGAIERLLDLGASLRPGAFLALEIGEGQAAAVAALARRSGLYAEPQIANDLAGIARNVVLERVDPVRG